MHYHLAKLLREAGKPDEARREVLRSLEEAPRFREAHQLLLELVEHGPPAGYLAAGESYSRECNDHDTTTPDSLARSSACWRSPPACRLASRFGAGRRIRPGSDSRGSRRRAQLEGRRSASRKMYLHLCELNTIRSVGRRRVPRRLAVAGAAAALAARRRLGHRFSRQRLEFLVPPPATDVAQGQPGSDHDAADRRAALRLSRSSTSSSRVRFRSPRRKPARCGAICSTAAS